MTAATIPEPVYFPDDPFGPAKPPPVTSYDEAIAAIPPRIANVLRIRYEDFDNLCGFSAGLTGKCLGPAQVKRFGVDMFFAALRGAGLRIILEEDPEQTAKMLKQIANNYNPRQANQARMGNDASPVGTHMLRRVFKHLSRLGGKARQKKMTKKQRSASASHAANSRWTAHRKRSKAAVKGAQTRKRALKNDTA